MTFHQKLRLLQGLLTRETAFAGPFAMTVDVTRRCNLQCLGCAFHSPHAANKASGEPSPPDLDADLFERLCGELRSMGAGVMVFCGEGEPLLHPRIFEMIRTAKDAGFRTAILTNGTLLDESTVRSLLDSGLDRARVSLWASTPEEYEKNYPGTKPEYFTKVVEGLRLLISARELAASRSPRVELHFVVNRYNHRGVDSYVDLALDAGCDGVSFAPLVTHGGQFADFGLSSEEEEDLKAQLFRAKKKLSSRGMAHSIDETIQRYGFGPSSRETTPCYIGWLHCRMKLDGTVRPCNPCDWPVGNLREQTMREIWNSPAYRSFRRKSLSQAANPDLEERCDCRYCCYITEITRVHRVYRWILPISNLIEEWRGGKDA